MGRLNVLPRDALEDELSRCCASSRWTRAVAAARPFGDRDALFAAAETAWAGLGEDEWREAIRHHPRLGRADDEQAPAATREWSSGEQAGVTASDAATRAALAAEQAAYERRFGYRFLICAAGKSGGEIRAALAQRMANDPATEIRVAAEELWKITRLRLERLA